MTVTIQVKPELAHRWKAIAEREGRALEAVVAEAAKIGLETLTKKARAQDAPAVSAERAAAIERAYGSLSHLDGNVDEFLRERSEEARREMERDFAADARYAALRWRRWLPTTRRA